MEKLSKIKTVCPEHENDEPDEFIFGETFDFYIACKKCKLRKECQKVYDKEEEVFYEHELSNHEEE